MTFFQQPKTDVRSLINACNDCDETRSLATQPSLNKQQENADQMGSSQRLPPAVATFSNQQLSPLRADSPLTAQALGLVRAAGQKQAVAITAPIPRNVAQPSESIVASDNDIIRVASRAAAPALPNPIRGRGDEDTVNCECTQTRMWMIAAIVAGIAAVFFALR